jgi:hypothetical protein
VLPSTGSLIPTACKLKKNQRAGYGYIINSGRRIYIIQAGGGHRFEHPGWNVGFHSLLIGDLVSGQGLVWMANGENGRKLGWEVTRGLAQVFGWRWS